MNIYKKEMKQMLVISLIVVLLSGESFANNKLSPWLNGMHVSDISIRAVKPGAIGSGKPLRNLVRGKLPQKMQIAREDHIFSKLRESTEIAIGVYLRVRQSSDFLQEN